VKKEPAYPKIEVDITDQLLSWEADSDGYCIDFLRH
jgi:hypothetical protein